MFCDFSNYYAVLCYDSNNKGGMMKNLIKRANELLKNKWVDDCDCIKALESEIFEKMDKNGDFEIELSSINTKSGQCKIIDGNCYEFLRRNK